jgi:hypothetical protein
MMRKFLLFASLPAAQPFEPCRRTQSRRPSSVLHRQGDETGKTVSLSDFKGKAVLLYFYPMDNTPVASSKRRAFATIIRNSKISIP